MSWRRLTIGRRGLNIGKRGLNKGNRRHTIGP